MKKGAIAVAVCFSLAVVGTKAEAKKHDRPPDRDGGRQDFGRGRDGFGAEWHFDPSVFVVTP